ncbi:hypothetical protein CYLTODRAFT_401084 [Cylindrobasidium torrendii FP15055 ss-10]|uniref:Uncharacterized protein n=1 Tax=Cylindrobasidium torrendii FP15055 ss-10 TaxID=1314674 RepID=A0A0D7B318_9AGAR|nr:hypothetical protein CYLTODRAFT_401084 [Cylindrobasidium torrendii FP15055 ss-10]
MTKYTGPGFEPNFSSTTSVVVNRPIKDVFTMIGTAEGYERVSRLSDFCTFCEAGLTDKVDLPSPHKLSESNVRTLPASTTGLPRLHWKMTESIPVVFGLAKFPVHLNGTLTWDEANNIALYESTTGLILVWKLRVFEEVEGGTRVTETIQGKAPFLLRSKVQSDASKGHAEHVSRYPRLFSE